MAKIIKIYNLRKLKVTVSIYEKVSEYRNLSVFCCSKPLGLPV